MKIYRNIMVWLLAGTLCLGACSFGPDGNPTEEPVTDTAGGEEETTEAVFPAEETEKETETEPEPENPHVLSLMTNTGYDHVWEDGRRLCYINYRKVWLDERENSGTGAQAFPELAQALKELNAQEENYAGEIIEELEAEARQMEGEGISRELSWEEDTWVVRADSQVLSLLKWDYIYQGGAHGVYGYTGITFDSQSGRQMELGEVVTDPVRLVELAADRLEEKYPDVDFFEGPGDTMKEEVEKGYLTWTAGYEGITLYFDPYELAPYAYGMQTVTILYKEEPELFVPQICQVPDSWTVRLVPGMEFDLGHDGTLDTVEANGVYGEYGRGSGYEQFQVQVNGQESMKELWFYGHTSYLVHADGLDTELLIADTVSDNDYRMMLVYELDPEKEGFRTPWEFSRLGFFSGVREMEDGTEEYGTQIFTDPNHFCLEAHIDLLSTYSGTRWYGVSQTARDTGYLEPEQSWFDVDRGDCYLTLMVPLEMETGETGESRMFPAGTKLWIVRVEGDYVGFLTEDKISCGVYVESPDWPGRIRGVDDMDITEIFDGMMFAG